MLAGLPALLLAGGAAAQSGAWQQCGGRNWSGATTCVSGYQCSVINEWYSQCIPGTGNGPPSTTLSSATRTSSQSRTAVTATSSSSSSAGGGIPPTQTGGGTNPGPTLVSGWYWVRAVAPPNFHSYLQAQPTGVPGDAYLSAETRAGQFNVVSGQLVYNTGAGGELYLHVENPADKTQRKLKTWFAKEKNAYGSFGFQGDTLTWHADDIKRPNEAAWLVCEGQHLFINTGAYGYQTPAGCADQTIHSYGGSTPDV
ncbi:Endoglucanase gh5-1 [Paramyrothecium foliicola]|nr:Endoglucanase gh5-1 [Paramyrothecium foliicola]